MQNTKPYTFEANPANEDAILTINSGKANGELVGGNLTVLTSIIGSGYLPDWKGRSYF